MRTWLSNALVFLLALLLFALLFGALVLNHAETYGLDDVKIEHPWIQQYYPPPEAQLLGSEVNGHWYYEYNGDLYRDNMPWHSCEGRFVGALKISQQLIMACSKELLLFDNYEFLSDRITQEYGMPDNIDTLGFIANQLFIRDKSTVYNIDLELLELYEAVSAKNVIWINKQLVPSYLSDPLFDNLDGVPVSTIIGDFYQWLLMAKNRVWLRDLALVLGMFITYFAAKYLWRRNDGVISVRKRKTAKHNESDHEFELDNLNNQVNETFEQTQKSQKKAVEEVDSLFFD